MAENMVKAGRAGLTFGGDWDSTVEYERLVGVRYDNKLFFSKKTVPIGTIPEDGEFWFLAYEGLTDEQWEALLNGTQRVGDSAKLGGEDASEYALHIDGNLTGSESILDKAKTVQGYGIFTFRFEGHDGTDLYNTGYAQGVATVFKRTSNRIAVYLWGSPSMSASKRVAVNYWNGTEWSGWDRDAKVTDLANYLPLSGGKLTKSNTPLILESTGEGVGSFLAFKNTHVAGHDYIGWRNHKFCVQVNGGEDKEVLHTGNKPSGTYTGNGDATERRIKVGGIGKVVYVFNTRGLAIVTTGGTAVFPNGGEFTWISATTLDSSTMEIVLKTDNANLNGSNLAFNYQVA